MTRALLWAGVVAGPLFVLIAVVQMLVRPGFDWLQHPVSLLSNGDFGAVQVANFVVTGVLLLAFALGVRRRLISGPASVWAPTMFAVCGVGLIVGGVFSADPALGFPVGAPEARPETMTLAGTIHAFAPTIGFTGLVVALAVVGGRFWRHHERRLAVATWAVSAATLALSLPVWPSVATIFLAITLGFAWTALIALRLAQRNGWASERAAGQVSDKRIAVSDGRGTIGLT